MLAGAERIIEREFEEEFEKEFRNPALEDTSLNDASLSEASLRAFNARIHTRTYIVCGEYGLLCLRGGRRISVWAPEIMLI